MNRLFDRALFEKSADYRTEILRRNLSWISFLRRCGLIDHANHDAARQRVISENVRDND